MNSQRNFWVQLAYLVPCHRKPTRCLHIHGKPMLICARCFSILLGYSFVPILLLIPISIPWWVGFIAQIPTMIDGFTQLWGWRESNNFFRVMTGLISGFGLSVLIVEALHVIRFILY